MSLLFDEDYEILNDSGLVYEEDEVNRYLIIKNYPLQKLLYHYNDQELESAEILVVIPPNYNAGGNDMFWTYPPLKRIDGIGIPAAFDFGGGDARFHQGKEYCRWSRHYENSSWIPKTDNIQKILGRIEWALKNPDSQK
ncbi:E2/UBC family protein [Flavobacterium aquidurense]|uniref:E2/UBC family protein n=1 Tax=Flavobacterium aquidurense TaxID=362413 RepID=UPI003756B341